MGNWIVFSKFELSTSYHRHCQNSIDTQAREIIDWDLSYERVQFRESNWKPFVVRTRHEYH